MKKAVVKLIVKIQAFKFNEQIMRTQRCHTKF